MTPVPGLRNITKQFTGLLASNHIKLTLEEGEIHAMLGEIRTGKSTLMNIPSGLHGPDEGGFYFRSRRMQSTSPTNAIRQGIAMVPQYFMLVPVLITAENVMLGKETTKGLVLDRQQVARRIRELSQKHGLEVDPDAAVENPSVGVRQRVEIITVLYRNANILILDEHTAALTPQEANDLFGILRTPRQHWASIIFISHRLREMLDLPDGVAVIRRGTVVGEVTTEGASQASLTKPMVGRQVALTVEKQTARAADTFFVAGFDLDGPRELDSHDAPVLGQALFCRLGPTN